MALKFLNKKGWHTGSLRNIENVWKAEQKNDAEQRKLEELRKQIQEERERSEFRLLQEQAGLVPKQERLDFLYDSGLAVGKGNSDGFKALEPLPKTDPEIGSSSSTKQQQPSVPGSLFEDKPQSANDSWRKLHSDPLLLIRQREQEALARVKNNPVQMAMIRKSAEAKKQKERASPRGKKHGSHKKKKHQKHGTALEDVAAKAAGEKRNHHHDGYSKSSKYKESTNSEDESNEEKMDIRSKKKKKKSSGSKDLMNEIENNNGARGEGSHSDDYQRERKGRRMNPESAKEVREDRKRRPYRSPPNLASSQEELRRHKQQSKGVNKLSEEERGARLREMQMDAELHEEQRWKRLRKAEEEDAREAAATTTSTHASGRSFLDAAHKSVYGAEKGGSSTIEESVRRRTHYSQRSGEGNAFRR